MSIKTKTAYIILEDGEPHTQHCTLSGHNDVVACDTLEGAADALTTWLSDDPDAAIVEATLTWDDSQRRIRSKVDAAAEPNESMEADT